MHDLTQLNPTPIYECTLPSTGKKVKFRPFLVKEERALLVAQESEDVSTLLNTLSNVIKSCIIKPPTLTVFDMEYMFLQIRAKSVGEYSQLLMTCDSCSAETIINIDIRSAVVHNADIDKRIQLSPTLSIQMKFPSLEEMAEINATNDPNRIMELAVIASMAEIYTDKEAIAVDGEDPAKMVQFIDTLTGAQFRKMEDFVKNTPTVTLSANWSCPKCNHVNEYTLKGLTDFF